MPAAEARARSLQYRAYMCEQVSKGHARHACVIALLSPTREQGEVFDGHIGKVPERVRVRRQEMEAMLAGSIVRRLLAADNKVNDCAAKPYSRMST